MELGVRAKAEVPKLSFDAKSQKEEYSTAFEAVARGETALKFFARRGIDKQGVYIAANIDFEGMEVFVKAKVKVRNGGWGEYSFGIDDKKFTIFDRQTLLEDQKLYIIKNKS